MLNRNAQYYKQKLSFFGRVVVEWRGENDYYASLYETDAKLQRNSIDVFGIGTTGPEALKSMFYSAAGFDDNGDVIEHRPPVIVFKVGSKPAKRIIFDGKLDCFAPA